jgi:hypothetical protein
LVAEIFKQAGLTSAFGMYRKEKIIMEDIIELSAHKSIMHKKAMITIVNAIVIVGLILGIWNLITGGTRFYPNVTAFRDRPCGGYLGFIDPTMEIWFTYCFLTSDVEEEIHEWYRSRGWFRFGERLLYPKINLGLVQIMITREFNTEKQANGNLLVVHSVHYLFFKPNSTVSPTP